MVSKKSGAVFEKGLIESYIAEYHKDPVTSEDLSTEDLIALQSPRTVKPRPPTFTSVPSLLSAFQNEWDSLMLESYELKQTMNQLKQELSQALYNQDSAIRVVTRLTKERDEARDALNKMSVGQIKTAPSSTAAASTNGDVGDEMQVDTPTPILPEAMVAKIDDYHARTKDTRKKRPIPEGWTPVDSIPAFTVQKKEASLVPAGSKAMALNTNKSGGGKVSIIGGCDGESTISTHIDD